MTHETNGWQLPIGEAELNSMTRDLHEAHHTYLPAMQASAAELIEQLRDERSERAADQRRAVATSRRGFLAGAGGLAAMFTLAGCSTSAASPKSGSGLAPNQAEALPQTTPSTSSNSVYTGDLQIVALAAALENQAVSTYDAALTAAEAGKLGTVPPAVTTFATTAMSQHTDHAKAWNSILTGAGVPAITDVPLSNQAATVQALNAAIDVTGVAKLALMLEQQSAETYLFATYNVTNTAGIATAATIAPVEAMHAAILNFVLGQYPVPDHFLSSDQAASPGLLTV